MDTVLIQNNEVVQVWRNTELEDLNLPDVQGELREFNSGTVIAGMVYDGENVSIPPKPLPTESELQEYLANKRWEVETGGALFNGLTIPTDDRAKTLIEGAADELGDAETTSFKVDGTWMTLDGITMRLVRTTLRAHVKNCFAKEAEISGLIDDGDITSYEQIDAQNWPS